jgi:riboflavin synthase
MFTGIVETVGQISAVESRGSDLRLRISAPGLELGEVRLGDSIAVSGVCLTVTDLESGAFWADLSAETLRITRLAEVGVGWRCNLERALTLSKPLGGHLVSGHVDGIGRVLAITSEGRARRYRIGAPASLMRYIADRGSISVDGISLTVTGLGDDHFGLTIVPHTLSGTTLPDLKVGDRLHLEVDLLARYLERLLDSRDGVGKQGVTLGLLAENGFLNRRGGT